MNTCNVRFPIARKWARGDRWHNTGGGHQSSARIADRPQTSRGPLVDTQRWATWRVNASFSRAVPPSQGLPLVECALADYDFALPDAALFTCTASASASLSAHRPPTMSWSHPFSPSASATSAAAVAASSSSPSLSSAAAGYFTESFTDTVSTTCSITTATTNASRSSICPSRENNNNETEETTKTESRSRGRRRPPRGHGVPFVDHPIVFKSNHRRRNP